MDLLFSAEFFSALFAIIIIDLVLAGDNAIVIALAARNLPKEQQKKAIIWGTAGAIIIRIIATLAVVLLLKIKGLMLVGGILLLWIAYKLLSEKKEEHNIQAEKSIWVAIRTIIIADAAMGLDNVLAVAGAANGHLILVIIGLVISVPIMVWGSGMIIRLIDRFPQIIYIGAAVLTWTAAKMLTEDLLTIQFFNEYALLKWSLIVLVVIGILLAGWLKQKQHMATPAPSKS